MSGILEATIAQTEVSAGPIPRRSVLTHNLFSGFVVDPLAQVPLNDFPFGEVFAGLVRVAPDGTGDAVPDLAESWRVSADGLRYTFALRDGLRFSNGEPLVAADVKWSWERALTPAYVTPQAREVFGAVRGAIAMMAGESATLSGVNVVDDATLAVELTRPQAHFIHLLADPLASVLSEGNFENWGTLNWVEKELSAEWDPRESLSFAELPVAAGPFRITGYEYPNYATLEPNPFRWIGAPAVDEIVAADLYHTRFQTPREPAPEEFDTKRTRRATFEWLSDQQAADDSASEFVPVLFATAPPVTFLALNTALPPFNDVEFRRALSLAADRSLPLKDGAEISGLPAGPASGLMPPRFPGHVGADEYSGPQIELARAHLTRSLHVGGGYDALQFLDDGGTLNPGFFRHFSEPWVSSLGVEAETVFSDHFPQSDEVIPLDHFNEALADGTLQMRYVHVQPRYPDPCAILCRIPDLFGPNALSDETELLREMLHDAAATADRAARIAKYQAIEAHILDRALVIPAYWDDGTVYELVRPYISGYKIPAYGGSRYEDVVVDTTHPDYPAGR